MRKTLMILAAVFTLAGSTAYADSITKPTTFTLYDQVNKIGSVINVDAVNKKIRIGENIGSGVLSIQHSGDTSTSGHIQLRQGSQALKAMPQQTLAGLSTIQQKVSLLEAAQDRPTLQKASHPEMVH